MQSVVLVENDEEERTLRQGLATRIPEGRREDEGSPCKEGEGKGEGHRAIEAIRGETSSTRKVGFMTGFGHPPVLTGKAANKFLAQDRQPLTEKQKEHLRKCLKVYEDNPIR